MAVATKEDCEKQIKELTKEGLDKDAAIAALVEEVEGLRKSIKGKEELLRENEKLLVMRVEQVRELQRCLEV